MWFVMTGRIHLNQSHILPQQFLLYSVPFFLGTRFCFLSHHIRNFGRFWNLCWLRYAKLVLWPVHGGKGEKWQPDSIKISVVCLLEGILSPERNLDSSSGVWNSLYSYSRFYLHIRLLRASSSAEPGGSPLGYSCVSNSSISGSYDSCTFSCNSFQLSFANCSQLSVDDSIHKKSLDAQRQWSLAVVSEQWELFRIWYKLGTF